MKQRIIKKIENEPFDGPEDWFTGKVKVKMLFQEDENISVNAACVTFEQGARTVWHTHPCGQRLICIEGKGITAEWGGKVHLFQEGDVIVCPPNVKHWHGATPDSSMTHIAITGSKDGQVVEWLEKVSDEDYQK